jgi:hypothetical protein
MAKRIWIFPLAVMLFTIGFIPGIAAAHRIYFGWRIIQEEDSSGNCSEGKITTDHGSLGNGYFQMEGVMDGPALIGDAWVPCAVHVSSAAGVLRIRLKVWKQNATTNCFQTTWVTNPTNTKFMSIYRPVNFSTHPYTKPPCGAGNYWDAGAFGPVAWGDPWLINEASHYLPTSPGGNGG